MSSRSPGLKIQSSGSIQIVSLGMGLLWPTHPVVPLFPVAWCGVLRLTGQATRCGPNPSCNGAAGDGNALGFTGPRWLSREGFGPSHSAWCAGRGTEGGAGSLHGGKERGGPCGVARAHWRGPALSRGLDPAVSFGDSVVCFSDTSSALSWCCSFRRRRLGKAAERC